MPQLAFFPWIELACDIDTGGYSLRRFARGRLPGPDPDAQATIDAVLAPYRDLTDRPIRNAVILAAHDRGLTETRRIPRIESHRGPLQGPGARACEPGREADQAGRSLARSAASFPRT